MKRALFVLGLLAIAAVASAQVKPSGQYNKKFTNCAATGSAAQVLPNGKYVMTVHDERTTVCFNSLCDGGVQSGIDYGASFGLHIRLAGADGGTPVACASSGATGDVHFMRDVELP